MVKKLYKHEFPAWLRVLPIFFGVTLLTAAFHRVLQIFEVNSIYYDIVNVSAIVLYAVSVLVCLAAPTVFGIVRFYKNLFTGEGYLSFTLPVTAAQHIWVKTLTASAMVLLTMLLLGVSFFALSYGTTAAEKREEMRTRAELIAQMAATYLTAEEDQRVDQQEAFGKLAEVASRMSDVDFLICTAQGGVVLTLEPHLAEFVGLKALEGGQERSEVGGLNFENNRAAFDHAVLKLREILDA